MLSVLLVVLVVGHGLILSYVSSHLVLSTTVLSGAVLLLLVKHVGVFGLIHARIRRRRLPNGSRRGPLRRY
jgi:hypothetical protein